MARFVSPLAVGALVVLAGCDGMSAVPLPGTAGTGAGSYPVMIKFDDVSTLVEKSQVKVAQETVGKVTSIEREGWHASVTVSLEGDVRLPANAVAKVAQTSLLGAKHVELAAPASRPPRGRLSAGDVIPLSRTGSYPETETVLSAASMVVTGGGLSQLQTITRELNAAMSGREQSIRDLLTQLRSFIGGIEEHEADIVAALEGLDRLSSRLAADRATVAEAIDRIQPALEVLNTQQQDLTEMLVALGELGEVGTRLLESSRADLLATLDNLDPILSRLAEAGKDLPQSLILAASLPFPVTTTDNALLGDYLNLNVTLDLTLPSLRNEFLSGTPLGPGNQPSAATTPLLDGLAGGQR